MHLRFDARSRSAACNPPPGARRRPARRSKHKAGCVPSTRTVLDADYFFRARVFFFARFIFIEATWRIAFVAPVRNCFDAFEAPFLLIQF
jgi:hypothetical protein